MNAPVLRPSLAARASCASVSVFALRLLPMLAASFPLLALADPPVVLAPVRVESSPRLSAQDALIHPVDVVDAEALQERGGGTLGELLGSRPGMANASFGPGVGRPVIRGQGGPRVQILENGIGTMDASTVSADHAVAVEPLHAEQIEIIKGPATLMFGSGASAGIVNLVDDRLSEQPREGLRLDLDSRYGSNADERIGALKLRHGSGPLQFGGQYARREAGAFSIPGRAEREGAGDGEPEEHASAEGLLPNSDLRSESYGAHAAWVGSRGMLGAALSRLESNYGVPGHAHDHDHDHDHGGSGSDAATHEGVRIDLQQTRLDLRARLQAPGPGIEHLEARVGHNDYQHAEIDGEGSVHTLFEIRELEGRSELKHSARAGWTGVVGLQARDRDFRSQGAEAAFAPPVQTRSLGLFIVEGRELGRHGLELGGRLERVEHQPGVAASPGRNFLPLSLSAGGRFALAPGLQLRINAQHAERAPASEELYARGAHLATGSYERGQLGLDTETAHSVDLSLQGDRGRWQWELASHYTRTADYVFLQEVDDNGDGEADRVDEQGAAEPDGPLLLLDYQQRDAEFYGAEASIRYRLLQSGPLRLAVHGFADTVRGRLADGGEPLPRITPTRFGTGLTATAGAFDAGIDYLRAQEQTRTGRLETPTPGYDQLSARLSYALSAGRSTATLYLQGNNLLDETIRPSTSFVKDIAPQPGRSLFAGVRLQFDSAR